MDSQEIFPDRMNFASGEESEARLFFGQLAFISALVASALLMQVVQVKTQAPSAISSQTLTSASLTPKVPRSSF